jgi:hypothetical protein
MHIYKFTHIETGRCYVGQTIQQPNRRRLEHSELMSEINKKTSGGKTWKIINGKRTWLNKEASV